MTTDHNEAMRLAEWLKARQSHLGSSRESCWDGEQRCWDNYDQAAALLRKQAARIAELEAEIANLHTTMMAAAVEIHEHWDAHCDAEGYGPANLMHRLERGIASQYGYDAKTLQRVEAERDTLRAEVERLRKDGERLDHIQKHARCDPKMDGQHVWWPTNFKHALTGNTLRDAIDRAIEAAKEAK